MKRFVCLIVMISNGRELGVQKSEPAQCGIIVWNTTGTLWVVSGLFKLETEGDIFLAMSLSKSLFVENGMAHT